MIVFAHPESGRHRISVIGVGTLLKHPSSSHSLLSCLTNANSSGVLAGFVIIGRPFSSRSYVPSSIVGTTSSIALIVFTIKGSSFSSVSGWSMTLTLRLIRCPYFFLPAAAASADLT